MRSAKTRDLVYIALFAVLIALCAWITIPAVVPFTLQTFGVFTACGILGGRRGSLAVTVYLLLGLCGIPVFSGFRSGPAALLGPTGGYLLGFLVAALAYWLITRLAGEGTAAIAAAMLLGLLLCYAFGTVWYVWLTARDAGSIGWGVALARCVFPFILPDLLKIALAVTLSRRLKKLLP